MSTRTPIDPSEIRFGDLIRWESHTSDTAREFRHNEFDGFAIATTPDGIAAYGDLPIGMRIMAWVKPNAAPGAHRLRSLWEPVLLYPPVGRRSNRGGMGALPDVLTANAPRRGFVGAKPDAWTRWVLAAMSHDPDVDEVVDLFFGSGAVAAVLDSPPLSFSKTPQ